MLTIVQCGGLGFGTFGCPGSGEPRSAFYLEHRHELVFSEIKNRKCGPLNCAGIESTWNRGRMTVGESRLKVLWADGSKPWAC